MFVMILQPQVQTFFHSVLTSPFIVKSATYIFVFLGNIWKIDLSSLENYMSLSSLGLATVISVSVFVCATAITFALGITWCSRALVHCFAGWLCWYYWKIGPLVHCTLYTFLPTYNFSFISVSSFDPSFQDINIPKYFPGVYSPECFFLLSNEKRLVKERTQSLTDF